MTARRFELHFAGPSNAGLRRAIRRAVDGVMPACGPAAERAVLALGRSVALTASGRHKLAAAAKDYREAWREYDRRCDCDGCEAAREAKLVDGGAS